MIRVLPWVPCSGEGPTYSVFWIWLAVWITFSDNRNPVANSMSFPGVRMVMARLLLRRWSAGPNATRISSGSSTATKSSQVCLV